MNDFTSKSGCNSDKNNYDDQSRGNKIFSADSLNSLNLEACDKLYNKCIEIRNFEINNLVNRNNFFMIFQGVLIAGVLQSAKDAPPIVQFLSTFVGLVISGLQTMTACGAKFWQEAWEEQLSSTEIRLSNLVEIHEKRNFHKLFCENSEKIKNDVKRRTQDTNFLMKNIIIYKFSVSKSPIYVGFSFFIFWMFMLLFTIKGNFGTDFLKLINGFPK